MGDEVNQNGSVAGTSDLNKKTGFLFYFDVLGYRKFMEKQSQRALEDFAALLDGTPWSVTRTMTALLQGKDYDKSKIFMRGFSDNFLYVYESVQDDENLRGVMVIASLVQQEFLKRGFLIRGSISYGEVWYSDQIVFGESLVRAVELEENHHEPSVVIDSNLSSRNNKLPPFVSPLYCQRQSKPDLELIVAGLNKALSRLDEDFDEGVAEKIKWIIERVNEHFGSSLAVSFAKNKTQKSILIKEDALHE